MELFHTDTDYSTLILGVFPFARFRVNVSRCRYSAVKLLSKYSNIRDHGTWTLHTDRWTDDILWHHRTRAAQHRAV